MDRRVFQRKRAAHPERRLCAKHRDACSGLAGSGKPEQRLAAAADIFCNNIGKSAKDLVFTQLKHLVNTRPVGTAIPPATLKIIAAFGKTIPAAVKPKGGQ
jgi:hypothetical protein